MILEIDGKKIGENEKTYFIAEGGLNHNGDVEIAKKLTEEAHIAGADAIKFQTYKTEKFVTRTNKYYSFFKDVELSFEEFKEIQNFAKNIGITFFSSPFDLESVYFLKQIDVPCFKIASSEITNMPLLHNIAKMQVPMIISTGGATLLEIDEALKCCQSVGNSNIALMHCVLNYPAQPNEVNLKAMNTLREEFKIPIGYSDNGESSLVDLIAVGLGANLIEKHFTLDKKMNGPDHAFSIEPNELKILISQIRLIEEMRGDGKKIPQPSEINIKPITRKSLIATTNISKGEVFSEINVSIKRPAEGIEPKYFEQIIGKKAKKDIREDEAIKPNYVDGFESTKK